MTDQTIPEFVTEKGIRLSVLDGPIPDVTDGWESNRYKVRLRLGNRTITTDYRMGLGLTHAPTAEGVLNSLLTDSEFGDYDWDEFCSEAGYGQFLDAAWDEEEAAQKAKAEKAYKACVHMRKRLPEFLGGESEYDRLRECERL